MSQRNNDIETTYTHTYSSRFIIDRDPEFGRMKEMGLENYDRLFFVMDENVERIYRDKILANTVSINQEFHILSVKPEEHSKSIDFYPVLVSFLEEKNAGRYDAVIAVGGGIIIDLVSFTVSTYMRGLPLFIIATTLIGQTDATTAGKTCLNSRNAKNLLGTFYYPIVVYNSIEILRTCPKRITRQGLSEAFKYSLLTDGKALQDIIDFCTHEFDSDVMERIVRKTIESRIAVRKVDPLASNLGHTFGHALEKYSGYTVLHGDAILTGTVMAMTYAVEKGLMKEEEKERIFAMMKEAGLNIYIPEDFQPERLVEYMRKDKKSSSKKLHLVMIQGIGKPYRGLTPFLEADYDDVEDFLKRYTASYPYKKSDYAEYLNKESLD
ncbi:MAG: 3-dehydroquinate synthase [Solobacterium sp.]|nr:3-dehydroquinate synthase [Solobacterium sp.]